MQTQFWYKNHRGEVELRTVEVVSLDYVSGPNLDYGYGPGWFLHCRDFSRGRNGEPRSFALNNIQMKDFRLDARPGVAAFSIMLFNKQSPKTFPIQVEGAAPIWTGVNDANGMPLLLGDRVLYKLEGDHTKPEYWNPEYEIVWEPPCFTLKHVGGGLDGGSNDFKLKFGGRNGNLFLISRNGQRVPERVAEVVQQVIGSTPVEREKFEYQGSVYELTGKMHEATKASWGGEDRQKLTGTMFGHPTIPDGTTDIWTSLIVAEIEKNVFLTKSGSVYRVETWADEAQGG